MGLMGWLREPEIGASGEEEQGAGKGWGWGCWGFSRVHSGIFCFSSVFIGMVQDVDSS